MLLDIHILSHVLIILATPCSTSDKLNLRLFSGTGRNYLLLVQYWICLSNINLLSISWSMCHLSYHPEILVFRPQFGLLSQQVIHQRKHTACSPEGLTSIAQINDHFSKLQHLRILTVGCSLTLIITAASICSDGFFSFFFL